MPYGQVILTPPTTPPRPPPLADDLSDNEEAEYHSMMHSSSGDAVRLLFSKSKVYVHPTPSSKDNIAGFVALVEGNKATSDTNTSHHGEIKGDIHAKSSSLLLTWLPESTLGTAQGSYLKVEEDGRSTPPSESTPSVPHPPIRLTHEDGIGTYAFAIPLHEVYSLLVRPPSLGWWFGSLVINTKAGDSFPALFFHDDECQSTILQKKQIVKERFDPFDQAGGTFWGGDEVLRWLRKYVSIERSGADPAIYLVNPSPEDKLAFGGETSSSKAGLRPSSQSQVTRPPKDQSTSSTTSPDASMDPLTKALKQARWTFLEKMSQVTNFTRRTAESVADNPRVPPQMRRLMINPEIQTLQEEFDSARVYLARWAMSIAEQSDRDRRQRIVTAQNVLGREDTDVGEFELLDLTTSNLSLKANRRPITKEEWRDFFDSESGYLRVTVDEVKERIFHGGFDASDGVRKEGWLFLLDVFDWHSSTAERAKDLQAKRELFVKLKGAWWERIVEGHGTKEQAEWWKEQRGRIEKDVHRTDRHIPLFEGEDVPHPDADSPFAEVGTNVHLEQMKDMLFTYNEYNKDLGYVQGMSDLLAPIYAVVQDDAIAFWAFVGFMNRMERNFLRDQSGMRAQLLTLDHLVQLMDPKLYLHLESADSTNFFFFFRMLLVWYKREFEWSDILRLWETLWTDWLSSQFHIFIALAILEKHRDVIMAHLKRFDEVLKYVNDLSNTLDVSEILLLAERLYQRFQRTVEAIDKQDNFPLPNTSKTELESSDKKDDAAIAHPSSFTAVSRMNTDRSPKSSANALKLNETTKTPSKSLVISPELRVLLQTSSDKQNLKS